MCQFRIPWEARCRCCLEPARCRWILEDKGRWWLVSRPSLELHQCCRGFCDLLQTISLISDSIQRVLFYAFLRNSRSLDGRCVQVMRLLPFAISYFFQSFQTSCWYFDFRILVHFHFSSLDNGTCATAICNIWWVGHAIIWNPDLMFRC